MLSTAVTVLVAALLSPATGTATGAGNYVTVSVNSTQAKQLSLFVQCQVNRGSPFVAKVTNIVYAKKQVLTSSQSNWQIQVVLTNTTCTVPYLPWGACCYRSQTKTCLAIAGLSTRSREFTLVNITCSPSDPRSGCPGCLQPQRDLHTFVNITKKALDLYASANAISAASLRYVVSVSTQVVAGVKYYIEATVNISGRVYVCTFQVVERPWTSPVYTLISGSCGYCTSPW